MSPRTDAAGTRLSTQPSRPEGLEGERDIGELNIRIVSAEALRALMRALLIGVGTAPETAAVVGDSLVDANLAGHDSHGLMRLLLYLEMVGEGRVDPRAEGEVIRRDRARSSSLWCACGRRRGPRSNGRSNGFWSPSGPQTLRNAPTPNRLRRHRRGEKEPESASGGGRCTMWCYRIAPPVTDLGFLLISGLRDRHPECPSARKNIGVPGHRGSTSRQPTCPPAAPRRRCGTAHSTAARTVRTPWAARDRHRPPPASLARIGTPRNPAERRPGAARPVDAAPG